VVVGKKSRRTSPDRTSRAERGAGWFVVAGTLIVFAAALLAHLVLWNQYQADPFLETPVSDALSYHLWAQRIVERGLEAEPVFHQAPFFPVLLAWIYSPAPVAARMQAAIAMQAVLTSLAIALLVPLGRRYLGSTAVGLAGAGFALLHGPILFHSLKLLPVPLAIAAQALGWTALAIARRRPSPLPAAGAGFAMGLAALARPEMLLAAPVAMIALPRVGTGRLRGLGLAASFLLGFALALSPATVHNVRQGDWVWVASSGGENLFIGNQRGATGEYSALHPKAGDLFSERELAKQVAEEARGRPLLPSEVSSYWRDRAIEEIRADHAAWLRLEWLKLRRILHPGDPTDIYSFPLERSLYLPFLHALPLPPWTLLGAGLVGLALALRLRPRQAWPLAAWVAIHLLVLLAFFVNTRLRLPMLFALAPFAGFALVEGWRRWKEGTGRTAIAVIAGAVIALTVAGAILTRPSPRDTVRLASVLSTQSKLDEALEVLEPVLSGPEPYGLALDQAGWVLQKKGDFAAAAERYRQALEAGVPEGRETQTRTRLAMSLERAGDVEGSRRQHDLAVTSGDASAGTYYERAMFRMRTGDRAGAEQDLREAIRLDPGWRPPRAALERLRAGS
jgi:tetratricopeptide (TPR) repeat protein